MAVEKIYQFTCDYCGYAINHLPFIPKTKEAYDSWKIKYMEGKHFCDDYCYKQYCLLNKEKENE